MNTPKTIDSVVEDIYSLFSSPHKCSEENVRLLGESISTIISRRLSEGERDGEYLRISNVGRGDRQVYYDCHPHGNEEKLEPWARIKFLYGDLIEALLIFLAREAGHTVEGEQAQVEIDGVRGHSDGKLDGKVFDVKSASAYGFRKFKDGSIFEHDPFGYIPQITGYNHALGGEGSSAYFLAMEKQSGHLALTEVPPEKQVDIRARITHMKDVVSSDTPPPRCHPDEEEGKSGNRKLGVSCSYCRHKWECWPGLRMFLYAKGPVWLTEVKNEPRVIELSQSGTVIEKENLDAH